MGIDPTTILDKVFQWKYEYDLAIQLIKTDKS